MSTTSIIAAILLAMAAALVVIGSASAQYGPPMWSRNPRDYREVPYGPQVKPCVYRGDCRHQPYFPPYYGPHYRLPPYPDGPSYPSGRGPYPDYDE
jgi:hypothetical protein